MPSDQEVSSPCCHMVPMHAHLVCIIRIISLLYHYYTYYFKIRNGTGVLRIHSTGRKLANQHIHHRGSVSIQTKSIRDSIINLQQALSHAVSFHNQQHILIIGLADVRQPCCTQFRLELSTHPLIVAAMTELFSCQTWSGIPSLIQNCNIIDIISIIGIRDIRDIICLITITF